MRYTIVIIGIVLAIAALIAGSYMPLVKAQLYISSVNNLSNVKTIEGFKTNFDKVFNYPSPIGDEESFKFLSTNIVGFVSNKSQPEAVSRALVDYIEPKADINDVIHLITMANLYKIMWQNFGSDTDYQKAESYLRQSLVIGPKLPPTLYILIDLYAAKGDIVQTREIVSKVLELWPDDVSARQVWEKIK